MDVDRPGHCHLSGVFFFEEAFLLLVLEREHSSGKDGPVYPALDHSGKVGHEEQTPVELNLPPNTRTSVSQIDPKQNRDILHGYLLTQFGLFC